MTEVWIINGRCLACVSRELDDDVDCYSIGCGCWCHDDANDDEAEGYGDDD